MDMAAWQESWIDVVRAEGRKAGITEGLELVLNVEEACTAYW